MLPCTRQFVRIPLKVVRQEVWDSEIIIRFTFDEKHACNNDQGACDLRGNVKQTTTLPLEAFIDFVIAFAH